MIKLTGFMNRLPSMSHGEFVAYHRYSHGPLFLGIAAAQHHVVRYIQSHPVPAEGIDLPDTAYNGLSEIWFKDVAACKAVFTDPEYFAVVRPDELKFIDFARSGMSISEEYVLRA